MNELSKRILTSIFLISLFSLAFYNNLLLIILLIYCFYEMFFEFNYLLNKIYKYKNKIKVFIYLITVIIFLFYLTTFIWLSLYSGENSDKLFLILLISISILSDIGGFIFGKIFKGKKLTKISPKKTYSGLYGSYILSLIVVYILFSNYYDTRYLLLVTILISTISQLGDLFISFLKRRANLKDTGKILPGHGGFLDRFDGLIFAISAGSLVKIII